MNASPPDTLTVLRRTNPNRLAYELGFKSAPIDVFGLIRALGIGLFYIPDEPQFESISGQIQVQDSIPQIFISPHEALVRQRFSAAHELGHLILHTDELLHNGVLHRELRNDGYDQYEREADFFAAQLLMPSHLVGGYLESGLSVPALAKIFKVSSMAMSIRVREILGTHRQLTSQQRRVQ